ncbi:MAG: glycosyltransferase family 1 protein, partial [Bacteroidetes bacterium HGW-Bacteroidetes-23]
NEIIIHKQNGLIIPVKDEKILLEALSSVMEDTVLYEHLRSNARSMIVNRYEQTVVWEALLLEYEKIN